MKIFLDTAGIEEIRTAARWGVLDGVTTNPSLVAKEGRIFREVLLEICNIVDGPISADRCARRCQALPGRWRSACRRSPRRRA